MADARRSTGTYMGGDGSARNAAASIGFAIYRTQEMEDLISWMKTYNESADQLGEDYFVIGTDFYKTSCNLPKGNHGKRIHHTFYSYDPLARASQKCGFDRSYLDFSRIPDSSSLKKQTTDYTWMGSLGESYNALFMSLLPMSYRVWRSPAEMYDAMIFVTKAHPTEIKEAE